MFWSLLFWMFFIFKPMVLAEDAVLTETPVDTSTPTTTIAVTPTLTETLTPTMESTPTVTTAPTAIPTKKPTAVPTKAQVVTPTETPVMEPTMAVTPTVTDNSSNSSNPKKSGFTGYLPVIFIAFGLLMFIVPFLSPKLATKFKFKKQQQPPIIPPFTGLIS